MTAELNFSLSLSFAKDEDTLDVNWDDTQDVSLALSEQRVYDASTTLAQIAYSVVTNPQIIVWKNIGTATITIFGGNTTNPIAIVGAGKVGMLTIDSTCDLRLKTSSGTSRLKTGFVAT